MLAGCSSEKKINNKAEAHYFLGISYLQEKNPTLALKEFLQAEQIDSGNADLQAALAQAYQLKNAYPEAEKHYLRALKLRKDDPQNQNNLASLYLDMKNWDQAIRYFRLASESLIFTGQVNALTGLGYALHQKGEYLEAVSAFRKALAENPRYAQTHCMLGESYVALGKLDLAIGAFRQALVSAPGYARAHYQLGLVYSRQKENTKAAEAFRETVRLAPNSEFGQKAAEFLKLLR
jgi:Tfp pilus assembly protein PilF